MEGFPSSDKDQLFLAISKPHGPVSSSGGSRQSCSWQVWTHQNFRHIQCEGHQHLQGNVWSVYAQDSGNQPQIGHQPRHSSSFIGEGISFSLLDKDLVFIPCLLQNHVVILILNPLKCNHRMAKHTVCKLF